VPNSTSLTKLNCPTTLAASPTKVARHGLIGLVGSIGLFGLFVYK
jgi:hypothetical protein